MATHFALDRDPAHTHADGACTPIVWCVDPIAWNRSTPVLSEFGEAVHVLTTADDDLDPYRPETTKRRRKSPIAMFGAHNSARIVAQRGTFMVWETKPSLWKISLRNKRRPSGALNSLEIRFS